MAQEHAVIGCPRRLPTRACACPAFPCRFRPSRIGSPHGRREPGHRPTPARLITNTGDKTVYNNALNSPREEAILALRIGTSFSRIQPRSGISGFLSVEHDPTYHFWRPAPARQTPVAGLASVARMRDRAAAITGRTVSRPAAPGCRLSADVFGRRPAARRECVSPISSRPCGSQIPDVAVAPSRSSKDSTWQSV